LTLPRAAGVPAAAHLALACAGAMWIVPFLSPLHFYPIPTFHGELAAAMLGLAALSLWLAGRGSGPATLPATALLPVLLAALIGLQVVLGRLANPADGIVGALYLGWAAALLWLGAELRDRYGWERVVMVFAWCALAGALASAAIGLFQQYAPESIGRIAMRRMSPAIYANLGQPNHLAHQLAVGLASLVYLCATRRLSVIGGVLLAITMLFVAALTQSRSPWLYCAAFATLAGFQLRSLEPVTGRRLLVGSLLLVPGIGAAQLAAQLPFLQPASYTMLPIDRLFEVASGWSARVAVWKEAWEMFVSAPVLGAGFGEFAWRHFLQVSAADPVSAPGLYDHAHNLFLQLLAELGILAGASALLAVGAWIAGVLREAASPERWWVLAVAAVAGIHSMLEYPWWYAYFLGAAALLAGFADGHRLRLPRAFSPRVAFTPVVIVGWAVSFWLYFDYLRIEGLSVNIFTAGSGGDRMVRVRESLREISGPSLLQPYVDLGLASAEPLGRERLAEKLARNSRVLRFAPTREIAYRQAVLLALDGQAAAAQAQLSRSATYYPGFLATFAHVLKELEGTDPAAIGPLLRYSEERLNERRHHAVRAD
jgi:O-antigen ligase